MTTLNEITTRAYRALTALRVIASARPCLDSETTDADLAEWARTTIIPELEKAGLL